MQIENKGIMKNNRMKHVTRLHVLFLCFMFAAQFSYAQVLEKKVTIQVENISIEKALKIIKTTYGINFCYSPDQINVSKQISLTVSDASLEQTLDKLFKDTPITYVVIGNQIVLKKSGSITGNNKSGTKGFNSKTATSKSGFKNGYKTGKPTFETAAFITNQTRNHKRQTTYQINQLRDSYKSQIAALSKTYKVQKDCLRTENIKTNDDYHEQLKASWNKAKELLTKKYLQLRDSIQNATIDIETVRSENIQHSIYEKAEASSATNPLIVISGKESDALQINLIDNNKKGPNTIDKPLLKTIAGDTTQKAPKTVSVLFRNKYSQLEIYASETEQGNIIYKTGKKSLYHIFQAGGNFNINDYHWTLGYGVGSNINISPKSSLAIDFIGMHVNQKEAFTKKLNEHLQLRILYNYSISKNTSLFVGPTLNTAFTGSSAEPFTIPRGTTFLNNSIGTHNRGTISNPYWVGFQAGIRF